MATATLEELLVQINASTDGLRAELTKGNRGVESFRKNVDRQSARVESRFKKVGLALRTALAPLILLDAARRLVTFGKAAIEAGDAIGKAARTADFAAERFQRLQFAFEQGGVSSNQYDLSMQRLNRRLGLFIQNGGGPAAETIKRLGLEQDIANGKIQTAEQLFDAFVEKLQTVKNDAEAAALASALFGDEAGPKLVATLRLGTQGLREIEEAATGILSDEQVSKAEALNDAMSRLARTVGTTVKGAFIDAADATARFFEVEEAFRTPAQIGEQIAELEARAKSLREVLDNPVVANFDFAPPALVKQLRDTEDQLDSLFAKLRRISESSAAALSRSGGDTGPSNSFIELKGLPQDGAPGFSSAIPGIPDREEIEEVRQALIDLQEQNLRSQGRMADAIRLAADQQIEQWRRVAEETPAFAQEAADAISLINEKAERDIENLANKTTPVMEQFAATVAASFESEGIDALLNGDISEALQGMARDIAELIIRLTILKPLTEFLGGLFGGGGGGSLIPGRASGGPISAGQPYYVHKDELIVPDVSGRVLTAAQTARMMANGGGGAKVEQHFHVQAGLPPQWQQQMEGAARIAASAATQAVNRQLEGRR